MIRTLCYVVALLLAVPGAGAAPYGVSYEGNDYPENEGWTRYTVRGGTLCALSHFALFAHRTQP